MKEKSIEKQFLKFVLPSMLTMLLTGLYVIVDGFFIGHAVGDVGLAGIGLVYPITAILPSLGMGIGVGGSVLMSTYRGASNHQQANRARGNTFLLLIIASLMMTLFLLIFNPFLVKALGASGAVYDASIAYIRIVSLGGSMQMIASGLIPIIRNNHQTLQAMMIMLLGLMVNIILDALFTMVIPWGLSGAALATIIGQALTVVCSVFYLWRQKEHPIKRIDFKFNKKMTIQTIKIGIAPFGMTLMPSVVTVFNNFQCLAYGGNLAVSAYSVVNYFLASVLFLLEGIGEGIQPLISYYNGAKEYKIMKKIRNKGLITILLFSGAFLLLSVPAQTFLPKIFATSEETAAILSSALPILCIAFPMMGIGKFFTSYFYACGEAVFSTLTIYSDPLIFTPICIFVLPKIFGLTGVWMALPVAQALVMLLLTFLFILHTINYKNREAILFES